MKRAERYEVFVEPPKPEKKRKESRKSIPHSTRKCNPEGLLEEQIRQRTKAVAGVKSKYKKRHLKELPIQVREGIVKMYL